MWADPAVDPPVRFVPVAAWAFVDGIPGAKGPEACPVPTGASEPVIRAVVAREYLGAAAPGERPEEWADRARAALAL